MATEGAGSSNANAGVDHVDEQGNPGNTGSATDANGKSNHKRSRSTTTSPLTEAAAVASKVAGRGKDNPPPRRKTGQPKALNANPGKTAPAGASGSRPARSSKRPTAVSTADVVKMTSLWLSIVTTNGEFLQESLLGPLKNAILHLVTEERKAGGQAPKFEGVNWLQGAFMVKCSDEPTRNWLSSKGEALANALETTIVIGPLRPFMIPKPRATMIFFLEMGTTLPQDLCGTLAYQNGLCTDDWKEIGRFNEGKCWKVMVAIDDASR